MQDVHGKLNPGLPMQNQHSTIRRLSTPALVQGNTSVEQGYLLIYKGWLKLDVC
jgi:hypothetical protein